MNRSSEATRPSREWITDEALPGLATLLDVQRSGELLQEALLDPACEIAGAQIEYLRYKPQTNCLISYRLTLRNRMTEDSETRLLYGKCFTPEDYRLAHAKAETQRWVPTPPFPAWTARPELGIIFYMYPNDAHLFGLAIQSEPKKLQRLLYELPGPYSPASWRLSDRRLTVSTVRYKPEKRAVLRLATRAVHKTTGQREDLQVYLRTYADDRGRDIHRLMQGLRTFQDTGQGPVVPEPYGYVSERRLLLLEALPGRALTEYFKPRLDVEAVSCAGAALAALHRYRQADLPERDAASLWADVQASAASLVRVLPDSAARIGELMRSLERLGASGRSVPPAFVHGDFHHGQILIHDRRAALLDFDRSYLGDPAADLGNFCAHAHVLAASGRVDDARTLSEALLAGYERSGGTSAEPDRLTYWTVAGLLQLAVHPFRTLQPGWRKTTHSLLDLCGSLLT